MTETIIAANWKMHGTRQSVLGLMADLNRDLAAEPTDTRVVIFAPAVYLTLITEQLNQVNIKFGGQNLSEFAQGAYTGEISAPMLHDSGCEYVLVGHSERRQLFHESNQQIATKFLQAQQNELIPMLCVGETLDERDAEQTMQVIETQLQAVIDVAGINAFAEAVIAYEPVWAIGTGKTATPEQAQEVHSHIRQFLASKDESIAEKISILYGGSVKPNNAAELFAMPDINGALVGGASLDAQQFYQIIKAV